MLSSALETLGSAALVVVASLAAGSGIVAASGRREWSWTAPAVGLAAITVVAWWAARLPGHGWSALGAVAVVALVGGMVARKRLCIPGGTAVEAALVGAAALVVAAIPFLVEGHFGVLGSGFNVDMSQHLFAADWIADPSGTAPGLYEQGYPLGPHALAVASAELTGNPVTAFSGVTIALPALVALSALACLGGASRLRAGAVALLSAFAYLAASYLAQGSFKELFEVCFLIGFAMSLRELGVGDLSGRRALPAAVLGAGALYAYSAPGLAWLAGSLVLWGGAELLLRRDRAAAVARRALPALLGGLIALAPLAAPELDRIIDFGGSAGTVSESSRTEANGSGLRTERGATDPSSRGHREAPVVDNDLGNLFGQISPLEALGVWPSGDFRVAPGDGAVPAAVFYLGALLGAVALSLGIAAAVRARETALLGALVAAIAIWLAARIGSTPYTAAKALVMVAPFGVLIALRGAVVEGPARTPGRGRALFAATTAAAFAVAAGLSATLALANAPVGPTDYTPGVRDLSEGFAGRPTLLLAPDDVIADRHGEEFYGWELREARPACVAGESIEMPDGSPPPGFARFVTLGDEAERPFAGLRALASSEGVTLWGVGGPMNRAGPLADRADACAEMLG